MSVERSVAKHSDYQQGTGHQLDYLTQPDRYSPSKVKNNFYEEEFLSMPSTQAVIEHVKQDIDNFEDDLKKVSKPPSVERQQIIFLGKQLQSVKRKYYGTLKN